MRIKTITCHDVYNVGASLQAYALMAYLNKLGHEVEIINYKPDYLNKHYKLGVVGNPKYDKSVLREIYLLLKLPGRLKAKYSKRKKEYDNFTNTYLSCTKLIYRSNEELKHNPPMADLYFAGSDQIWNTIFSNGKDPAFYLDFVPSGCKKASYAASFATDDIESAWKNQITKWLSGLDYISVREKSGVEILNKLGFSRQVQVLDPVFLLDVNDWKKIEKKVVGSEHYILVYDFDHNDELKKLALRAAKEKRCKIYSVLPCKYADKSFEQEGPRAFINLVNNAQMVISNSFHATAFSVIFKKQFVVFERAEKINTRMQDLLALFGLDRQLVRTCNKKLDDLYTTYDFAESKIAESINWSKQYIDTVLSGGCYDR